MIKIMSITERASIPFSVSKKIRMFVIQHLEQNFYVSCYTGIQSVKSTKKK